ncbi:MAG: TOBE domain-containing protein [Verrucomicrobia bacterium]|nr:TOBE domain-containing protein [Verrucomicrobiota bacterium]
MASLHEIQVPALGLPDGHRLRIGFRPYAVQVSPDLSLYRYLGTLRRTYFLGTMLRLEIELESGLLIRARITKEEYAQLGLEDGQRISLQIRNYRVLATETGPLEPEIKVAYPSEPSMGENI